MKNIAKGVTPDGRIVEGFLFWMEIDGEVKPCISRSPLKVNDWGEVKYDGDVVLEVSIRYSTGKKDINGRTIYFSDIVEVEWYEGTWSQGFVCKDLAGAICVYNQEGFKNIHEGFPKVIESSERLGSTVQQHRDLKRRTKK